MIINEIQAAFEKQVGQAVHKTTIYRLLKRHHWRKITPRPRNPNSREAIQEEFKERLPQQIESLLKERSAADQRPLILMSQDEGRFGRINAPRRCWVPKPLRATVLKQVVRESLFVFAAVCPQLGKMTALILPFANSEMMQLFLEEVSKDFKNYFVIMLVDRAPWHTTEKLQLPEKLKLIAQPAGSPELNPTEHIWDDIREKEMRNYAFENLEQLENSLSQGINRLSGNPEYLKSMTHFPYLNLSILNAT